MNYLFDIVHFHIGLNTSTGVLERVVGQDASFSWGMTQLPFQSASDASSVRGFLSGLCPTSAVE